MDTFLTIVLAGVVGAFLGALAAFYLGELRDKQKQISARRIAEQRNLQKWRTEQQLRLKQWEEQEHQRLQERNQRLLDRRVEALDDIRIQALSFAFAFRSWADRAAHLKVQPIDDIEQAMGFSKGVAQLIDQGDEVSTKLTFLRGHYNAHSSILEQKSRHIIESFQRQSIERHSFLSNQLKATAAALQGFHLLSQAHQLEKMDGRSSHRDSKCWLGGVMGGLTQELGSTLLLSKRAAMGISTTNGPLRITGRQ